METLVKQLIDQNTELLKGLADYSGRILQLEQALTTANFRIEKLENGYAPEQKYNLAPDETYDYKALQKIVKVSSITLTNWVKQGKFPIPVVRTGNRRLWSGKDIIAWLRA